VAIYPKLRKIAKAIDAGKRKLGGIDRQIMQLAKSLNI
jgi:hypothetical protein